jgi:hypothetical protein
MYEEIERLKDSDLAMSGIERWVKLSKEEYTLHKQKKELEFKINAKRQEYRTYILKDLQKVLDARKQHVEIEHVIDILVQPDNDDE